MKLRSIIIAFFAYLGLAVVMTWPLVTHLSTHIMGAGGDAPIFLWDAWWVGKALLHHGELFTTSYIFYPQTVSLVFHTMTLVNSFIIAVGSTFISAILAMNLWFLLGVTLSGLSMFLLVRHLTKTSWPAFISGLIFAFAPYVTAHWLGHQNLTTLWFIPLFVLCLIKTIEEPRWRWPLGAGLLAGLASLNDFYNPLFLFIFTVMLGIWMLIAHRKCINKYLVVRVLGVGAVWLTVWSIWWVPAIRAALSSQQGAVMSLEQITAFYSADLLRYFIPSFLNPILGGFASLIPGRFSGGVEGTIFLGYTPLLIVLIFLIYKIRHKLKELVFPSVWFWVTTTIIFGVLSLGPNLKIAERIIHISLPYAWLYYLSEYWGEFRVPARFSLMVVFAVAVLVGIALAHLWPMLKKASLERIAVILVSTLIIIEFIPAPYPNLDLIPPAVYAYIQAQEDDAESLLDIPWGINSGYWDKGSYQSRFTYWATLHGKKTPIGSLARVPYEVFEFYPKAPLPFMTPLDDAFRLDLVVIHKNYFTPADVSAYRGVILSSGYLKIYEDATHIAYRKAEAPRGSDALVR
ncbi:hypothetical protein A2V68_02915 [candidate division Kazan bacterium RBG_13_50_9]|uniref:DUF6311 domain-containing protein n=1 Tax=candidate division Kazan bacterium RBG_13_50_9 TaxID=1798535 RepID=A0A1F4NSX1_UNCK3|nr:MAG: hypothetical protein A2V68_02915 [candidate division Kazan bacterium RBG_13_50_9]